MVAARKKAYPLKVGQLYDTKDSKMIESGVDLPTIYLKLVAWSDNVKKSYILRKRMVERGKCWNLEIYERHTSYKYEHCCVAGNKNIQSELKKSIY